MSNKNIKRLLAAILVIFAGTTTVILANTNQDKKFTIVLSEQEINVVLQGLSELPMKTGGNVYSSIMQQAQMQLQAQQKPATKDTTKKKP
jgi:hypothetical protein